MFLWLVIVTTEYYKYYSGIFHIHQQFQFLYCYVIQANSQHLTYSIPSRWISLRPRHNSNYEHPWWADANREWVKWAPTSSCRSPHPSWGQRSPSKSFFGLKFCYPKADASLHMPCGKDRNSHLLACHHELIIKYVSRRSGLEELENTRLNQHRKEERDKNELQSPASQGASEWKGLFTHSSPLTHPSIHSEGT